MPDLVGGRLGDVLGGVAEPVREDPGGLPVAVPVAGSAPAAAVDRVEDVDVGHAAAPARADRLLGADARRDEDVRAVGRVEDARAVDAGGAGVGRRHVDVEGRVVLGDVLPDRLDRGELGVAEGRAVARRVPRRLRGRRRRIAGVPPGAAGGAAVEVEVDRLRRAGLAVQQEGLVERRLGDDGIVGRGRSPSPSTKNTAPQVSTHADGSVVSSSVRLGGGHVVARRPRRRARSPRRRTACAPRAGRSRSTSLATTPGAAWAAAGTRGHASQCEQDGQGGHAETHGRTMHGGSSKRQGNASDASRLTQSEPASDHPM